MGGPSIVKVVISSNWRTDPDRYPWLVAQLKAHGVDVVGHTDIIKMHPCPAKPSILARSLEIRRVLQHRIVGVKGPFLTHERTNAFEASPLPENWKIMSWVAIDDLDLAAPQLEGLHTVRLLSRFMPLPSDPD